MRICVLIFIFFLASLVNAQEKSTKLDPAIQTPQASVEGGRISTARAPATNSCGQAIYQTIEVYKELPSGAVNLSKEIQQGVVGGFSPVVPGSSNTLAFPGGIGPTFPGGELAAWGCWESTCCAEWGRCCLPRYPSGWNCWSCCRRTEKCTRCIWPW